MAESGMGRQRGRGVLCGLLTGLAMELGAWLVASALRWLGSTWRCCVDSSNPPGDDVPIIGALWHGGLICAGYFFRDQGVVVPISRSRDGDRAARVLRRLGFGEFARGSSSRGGGAALVGAIRSARRGHRIGILCDGPRGPARRAKSGAVAVARASGLPLYPLAIAARPCLTLSSWDRAILPWPFARVVLRFGTPLQVPPDADRDDMERWRQRLESGLLELERELCVELGVAPPTTTTHTAS